MIRYMGIDPGKSGGLAVLRGPDYWAHAFGKDRTPVEIVLEEVEAARVEGEELVAVIERVGVMPGQGSTSGFRFGHSAGLVEGALLGLGVKHELVLPAAWQRGIPNLPGQKHGKTAHKRALKMEAARRFPKAKVTLATCDALLLADFCQREFSRRLEQ